MVIFLHFEMEDDGRRSNKKPGLFKWVFSSNRSSPSDRRKLSSSGGSLLYPLRERRPIRSVPLVGPHYRVEPEILVTEFVEKETKYLGTVTDLRCDFDASDRVELLKIVDEKRTLELLPCQLTYKNDIIISFSVHNLKLLRRDGEKLIHRIQTHKIAAVGYVRDDSQHLVFIKFASEINPEMCNLAVLCCETKTAAEEVCSLAQQVFQLVYTDSTIDFLDKSIMDGAITPKNHSYSTDDSDRKDTVTVSSREYTPYALRKSADSLNLIPTSRNGPSCQPVHQWSATSQTNIKRQLTEPLPVVQVGTSFTFPQQARVARQHRRSGSSGSSSNNNAAQVTSVSTTTLISPVTSTQAFPVQLQLHDYITVLKEQLTNVELKKFAELLHQFRTSGISIEEFCNQLLEMYTEKRKALLLGMRHFIPGPEDLAFFNQFLKDNDVEDVVPGSEVTSMTWWAKPPRNANRTFSETEESSTSTSVHAGQITAVSLSSSGSERASTSVNDDSGEWKDVIGNIERLGFYPSTDSSAGPELDQSLKAMNGTPPKHDSSKILEIPPLYLDSAILPAYAPPVADAPEGFRDTFDKANIEQVETSKSSDSTLKDSSSVKKGKSKKLSKTEKKRLSSSPDTLQERTLSFSSENSSETSHQLKKDDRKSSSKLPSGMSSEHEIVPSMVTKSQHSKPQKEHRKKKKHKEPSNTIEAVL